MSVAPSRPKGPPLNAMRAFEAAARRESFVAAAEELCVTPGAVSQHIKTLESWADTPLFQRNAQGVSLTSAGRALLPEFVAAFDAIGAATHALRDLRSTTEIHIAALPSVAQLWLAPRLGKIRQTMPEVEFSVTALEGPPNLARDLFDLSVFIQSFDGAPHSREIDRDRIFPVCAPGVAHRIKHPEDLNSLPRLHDQTWADDWTIWSEASGVALNDPQSGPRYSLYSLAVEEAKSGAGVLMGHASLIGEALQAGRLVPLFDTPCETGRSLILSLPERGRQTETLETVVDLLTCQNAVRPTP